MFKNAKNQIWDIAGCTRYFFVFAWKEIPSYFAYVIAGIVLKSIQPFIAILGTRYLIDEIASAINLSQNGSITAMTCFIGLSM